MLTEEQYVNMEDISLTLEVLNEDISNEVNPVQPENIWDMLRTLFVSNFDMFMLFKEEQSLNIDDISSTF